jgi:hypothetical protein
MCILGVAKLILLLKQKNMEMKQKLFLLFLRLCMVLGLIVWFVVYYFVTEFFSKYLECYEDGYDTIQWKCDDILPQIIMVLVHITLIFGGLYLYSKYFDWLNEKINK